MPLDFDNYFGFMSVYELKPGISLDADEKVCQTERRSEGVFLTLSVHTHREIFSESY